jgi:CheY-like chemotaxis protein
MEACPTPETVSPSHIARNGRERSGYPAIAEKRRGTMKRNGDRRIEVEDERGEEMKTEMPFNANAVRSLGQNGSVLVMDDEFSVRTFIFHMLKVSGYSAFLARTGDEALEYYIKAKQCGYPFDAVILDVHIPNGMGGKEVIKKLSEVDPGVKAVVMTGNSADPVLKNCSDYGFIEALPKPFTIHALITVLRRIISSAAGASQPSEQRIVL